MSDKPWYDELRDAYRPRSVRVLFIAESPPDPRGADRRFFYSPNLTRHDNLFRGLALGLYDLDRDALASTSKHDVLRRCQSDGYWMIDAVEHPINGLPPSPRRAAIEASVEDLATRCIRIDPTEGVFICSTPVHAASAARLRERGVTVLNVGAAPFPLGNCRAAFVRVLRASVAM